MDEIIGRWEEIRSIRQAENSKKSEFLALFGRRRIGKTYLIREMYKGKFTFHITGLANVSMKQQLMNFHLTLNDFDPITEREPASNWMIALRQLSEFIDTSTQKRKIIFIDELPWFDTMHSDFIQALEHFWNNWASARKDIFLIVCGSATSWMINKLINNKGGLHNRVTQRISLAPFTLSECRAFLSYKKVKLNDYQIVQLYMVFGGVPYYWDKVTKGKSAAQLIEQECFSLNGSLTNEFKNIFRSLFRNHERHVSIVKALATKAKGLTREEISSRSKIANGGGLTRLLEELEACHFITRYSPFGRKSRESLYQLTDMFTLFHFRFIENSNRKDRDNWLNAIDHPKQRSWLGYAFEQVCMHHIPQLKKALGISGVETHTSSWRSQNNEKAAQIDLIIDRRDQVINLCEMKFSIEPIIVTKKYADELRRKIAYFTHESKTRKTVSLTMITTFGVENEVYYGDLIQHNLKMEVLFEK